jgi:ribosome-binding factor A
MTQRTQQVASTLLKAVQEVIQRGLHDPRVRGLITVTSINVPPDLRTATVMISVLPEERQNLTLKGIQDAARHIRREVGELVAMRQVPELHFKLDLSLKRQAEVMNAIAKAAEDRARQEQAETPGDDEQPGPAPAPGEETR